MNETQEMVQGFEHKPAVWSEYKKGRKSYQEYLEAGKYMRPANLTIEEMMQYPMDTPKAADL